MTVETDEAGGPWRRWRPSDYVLHRQFCPIGDIQRYLDEYRGESGAEAVVVVALDAKVLLQTLTLVAHSGSQFGRRLADELSTHAIRRVDPSRENPLWVKIHDRELHSRLEGLADGGLYDGGVAPPFLQSLVEAWESEPWQLVAPFGPNPELTVNALLLQRGGRSHNGRDIAATVTECVNGTANASVHRDSAVTQDVEDVLETIASRATDLEPQALLAPLITMARRVTGSSAAALFLVEYGLADAGGESDDHNQWLVRATDDAEPGLRLRRTRLSTEPPRQGEADVGSLSYLHGRPFLLPAAAHTGMPRPVSTWTTEDGQPTPHELAVPVPGPGGGLLQNQGVIVLSRREGAQAAPFGRYELALLRNVALRAALLRGSMMVNDAADLVRQSATAYAMAEPAPSAGTVSAATSTSALSHAEGLPADFAAVMPTLEVCWTRSAA